MSVILKSHEPPVAERDPRPIVAVPRRRIPPAVIAAIALLAALILFLLIEAQRRSAQLETASGDEEALVPYAPPPPLSIPVEAAAQQPQFVPVAAAPPPLTVTPVVVPPPAPVQVREPVEPRYPPPPIIREYPQPAPPIQISERPPSVASTGAALVIDTSAEIPVGTLIPAVLETPIDTSRPGLARAIVARDTRGNDGQRVLVPRGSRLIGEYQSDVRSGQNRVLVNWTRLIRPDGASIRLGVPSADETGAAGIPGEYHSYFLKRFFNAALQTAMSVGGNLVGRSAGNTVVVGLPNVVGSTVGQSGQGLFSTEVRPKITVKPGTLFNVFVAKELDLSGTNTAQ